MESILEDKRTLHEQRDRLEMAISDEILMKKNGHKEMLDSQHKQKQLIDKYMTCSKQLLHLYKQFDTHRTNEQTINIGEACIKFYAALKKIKNQPIADLEPIPTEPNVADPIALLQTSDDQSIIGEDQTTTTLAKLEKFAEFTDEEAYGRYLDLNKCHEAYLQVVKREFNYIDFLLNLDKFSNLERDKKLTPAYKNYVEQLLEYFRDYSRRAKPLFDYQELEQETHQHFLDQWKNKTFPGWFTDEERNHPETIEPMIDLETYKSVEQLMELGLDCLKRELQVRHLKCGGTLEERARRLWSIRGKQPEDIEESLKTGHKKGKRKHSVEPLHIASIEAKIAAYADYYLDHIQATVENVQRKQARTADERNESDEDISDVEEDENEDSDVIYNPKNLPLGWDGKPIPYWLYKLHGLNLSFNCEICGNFTYRGPKTFQQHFVEQRHSHGMKCLGIPNTAHFANITSIQDAISLWDKLKKEKQKDNFQPQVEEEYEDSQGNVVNKKTYEDLKRQGLL